MIKRLVYIIILFRFILNIITWIYNFVVSLWFNLSFLPIKQGIKMPIWLNKPSFVRIDRMCKTCKIKINDNNPYFGMIKLGVKYNSWNPYNGIKLQLYGNVEFMGKTVIGNASTVYVAEDSCLSLGDNFIAASGLIIGCQKSIKFGSNSLIGWNCSFFDTDFHRLTNHESGMIYDKKAPIIIGNNNWIGCHCSIFKGFKSNDDTVISSHSVCKKRIVYRKKSTIGSSDNLMVINDKVYYNSNND